MQTTPWHACTRHTPRDPFPSTLIYRPDANTRALTYIRVLNGHVCKYLSLSLICTDFLLAQYCVVWNLSSLIPLLPIFAFYCFTFTGKWFI
jgi:hypothetical protein